jgi:hypothetical protein
VWGAVELSEHDYEITRIFALAKRIEAAGMSGVVYGIEYTIVKDWCEQNDEDPIYVFQLLKAMAAALNEKRN